MSGRRLTKLLREYDLEIDDIRWYLADLQAERLLQYRDNRQELTRLIWSGSLERDLYDMEERFLHDLESELERGLRDETDLRGLLKRIAGARERRYRAIS